MVKPSFLKLSEDENWLFKYMRKVLDLSAQTNTILKFFLEYFKSSRNPNL